MWNFLNTPESLDPCQNTDARKLAEAVRKRARKLFLCKRPKTLVRVSARKPRVRCARKRTKVAEKHGARKLA